MGNTVLRGGYSGWIIQEITGRKVTTAIISLQLLDDKEMTFLQLMKLTDGRQTGLGPFIVSTEETLRWRLSTGDQVGFDWVNGQLRILDVWGITDPEIARNRRVYSRVMRSYDEVSYSGLPITLENPELYPIQLISRYPLGGQIILAGEAGAGKSSLNLLIEDEMLAAYDRYPELNFAYIFWHIGERTVDRNTIKPILDKHPGREVYLFGPPRGIAGPLEYINTIEFIKGLIERLFELGRNVVACGDGLRGLVLDAYGQHKDAAGAGLTGSGVSTYGIHEAVKFLAHAGYTKSGSMTNIVTSLAAPPGGRGQAEQIRQELGLPEATMVSFVAKMNGDVRYPKVYKPGCDLRRPEILFRDRPEEYELHVLVNQWLDSLYRFDQRDDRKVLNANVILRTLQDFAQTDRDSFAASVPMWLKALKTKRFVVAKYEDRRWQDAVNAIAVVANGPFHVRRALVEATAQLCRLQVEILGEDSGGKPQPGISPANGTKSLMVLPVQGSVVESGSTITAHSEEPLAEPVPLAVQIIAEDKMATYQEIMDKWQTLVAARVVKPRGKFKHKAEQLAGTMTLEEFERKARVGDFG